jgi:hypothetical protein
MKRSDTAMPAEFRATCTRAEAARIDARFWAKVQQEGDCWIWTGTTIGYGYGRFGLTSKVLFVAHRWAWEDRYGPVPDGLQLDHLCRVPRCVNPDHLEPVTPHINTLRARRAAPARTHCDRGHELTEQNIRRNPKGWLLCKTCLNEGSNHGDGNSASRELKRNGCGRPRATRRTTAGSGHRWPLTTHGMERTRDTSVGLAAASAPQRKRASVA